MPRQEYQQVCLNGHQVTDATSARSHLMCDFCKKCGAETITSCPSCSQKIPGKVFYERVRSGINPYVPSYCPSCGHPYPWTTTKLEALKEYAQELEELDQTDKDILASSIDDLVTETPRTQVATARYKRVAKKLGKAAYDEIKELTVSVVSETIKKALFG